jgi:hypothetical protein
MFSAVYSPGLGNLLPCLSTGQTACVSEGEKRKKRKERS